MLLFATGCLLAGLATPASAGDDDEARLFGPDAEPFGESYEEWFGDYQVWLNEIPLDEHPFEVSDSPADCALQDDEVVFLVSKERCRVPEGASVAFDLGFWECSTAEGLGETFAELRRCARDNFRRDFDPDIWSIRLWLDGERVQHPRRWKFLTPGEIIDFPEENIWDAEPGPSKSVTKGFFYILRPLSEGTHVIRARLQLQGEEPFVFVSRLRVS
jgi:hypothetical protein